MLRQVKAMSDFKVHAIDGDIGEVQDFYFDDARWTIRYAVVTTSEEQGVGPMVLISPIAFGEVDWENRKLNLSLTRDRVRQSPGIDQDRPVSRQYEREYFKYYDWPSYWGYGGIWGPGEFPAALAADVWREIPEEAHSGDPHLRSVREVAGYYLRGQDGVIGHVEDFVADDASWTIRYLVIDTSNWWFGRHVLLSPAWIEEISWSAKEVQVQLPREVIRKSPEWKPGDPIDRDYELRLHAHYGWPTYWQSPS